jgi:hypothetical protein
VRLHTYKCECVAALIIYEPTARSGLFNLPVYGYNTRGPFHTREAYKLKSTPRYGSRLAKSDLAKLLISRATDVSPNSQHSCPSIGSAVAPPMQAVSAFSYIHTLTPSHFHTFTLSHLHIFTFS